MMIHQDGSTHEWVPGQVWDLIVTMDDANSEVYPAFFVEEEGTLSSFQGVKETLRKKGLTLQLPKGPHCRYLARKTIRVHQYPDGALAIYHGPRCLAAYTADGVLKKPGRKAAA